LVENRKLKITGGQLVEMLTNDAYEKQNKKAAAKVLISACAFFANR
jgi:hypothetical protein